VRLVELQAQFQSLTAWSVVTLYQLYQVTKKAVIQNFLIAPLLEVMSDLVKKL
jgi:hypothetical protein